MYKMDRKFFWKIKELSTGEIYTLPFKKTFDEIWRLCMIFDWDVLEKDNSSGELVIKEVEHTKYIVGFEYNIRQRLWEQRYC